MAYLSEDELIERLRGRGAFVIVKDGGPALRVPEGAAALDPDERESLKAHRQAVLDALSPPEGTLRCEECKAFVAVDASPEEAFRLCGRVMCPAWRPELKAVWDWVGAARSREQWKRRNPKGDKKR